MYLFPLCCRAPKIHQCAYFHSILTSLRSSSNTDWTHLRDSSHKILWAFMGIHASLKLFFFLLNLGASWDVYCTISLHHPPVQVQLVTFDPLSLSSSILPETLLFTSTHGPKTVSPSTFLRASIFCWSRRLIRIHRLRRLVWYIFSAGTHDLGRRSGGMGMPYSQPGHTNMQNGIRA